MQKGGREGAKNQRRGRGGEDDIGRNLGKPWPVKLTSLISVA